ncbi:MAG: hypothetical protein RLN62_02375 [Rickettsiales bacterium]
MLTICYNKPEKGGKIVTSYPYSNLPTKNIQKINPSVREGVVFIVGQMESGDYKKIKSPFDIEQALCEYNAQNILFINLSAKLITLEELKDLLANFAKENDSVSIVSAMHGFHMLPWTAHEMDYNSAEGDSIVDYAYGYLFLGSCIKTTEYVEALTSPIGSKLKSLWFASCQGNQISEDIASYMPVGSALYTESNGYVTHPEALLQACVHMLFINFPIEFNQLLSMEMEYLAEIESNSVYNYNPIKTIVGEEENQVVNWADLIDIFINRHFNMFDSSDYECYFANTCSFFEGKNDSFSNINSDQNFDFESKSISNCYTNHGALSWITETILLETGLSNKEYSSGYVQNDNCFFSPQEYINYYSEIALVGEDLFLVEM